MKILKHKTFRRLVPFLVLFAVAVLVVVLVRSISSAKRNNVPYLKMVWYEIKFLFSFEPFAPSIA
jgi:hypothetical protein